MRANQTTPRDINDYIARCPGNIRPILEKIRTTIRKAAPDAEEIISYQMPTFRQKGILVHFAAFSNHIGFFPTPSGITKFKEELTGYKGAKGSVQFPYDRPIPYGLITKIVKFRVNENLEIARAKEKKKSR